MGLPPRCAENRALRPGANLYLVTTPAGQAVAGEIPGARFVALDAGHSMMGEAPRELLAALKELLT